MYVHVHVRIYIRCWLKHMQWNNELEQVLLLGSIIVLLTLSLLMFTSQYNGKY